MSETQTTQERIAEMILRSIEQSIFDFDTGYDADPIAREISAEIDALKAQCQHCDLLLNSANADLRECQSALRLALAGTEQHYFAIPARIDDVRAALADAQAQLAEARANLRLAEIRINGFIGAQKDAEAEVAKLKPYAFVQIAKLKRDSAIEELDGAEDEEERRQCARDLGDWHEMAFRATNLMREQWERDRKTMVRVELGDMVKAACS